MFPRVLNVHSVVRLCLRVYEFRHSCNCVSLGEKIMKSKYQHKAKEKWLGCCSVSTNWLEGRQSPRMGCRKPIIQKKGEKKKIIFCNGVLISINNIKDWSRILNRSMPLYYITFSPWIKDSSKPPDRSPRKPEDKRDTSKKLKSEKTKGFSNTFNAQSKLIEIVLTNLLKATCFQDIRNVQIEWLT